MQSWVSCEVGGNHEERRILGNLERNPKATNSRTWRGSLFCLVTSQWHETYVTYSKGLPPEDQSEY